MLFEVLQNYMDAVNGATRLTQRNATAMARNMLIQAGMEPAADMVHQLSEQMIAAQDAQYAMIRQMVQSEVQRVVPASQVPDSGERTPTEAPSAPAAREKDSAEPDTRTAEPVRPEKSVTEEAPEQDRDARAEPEPVAEAPAEEAIAEAPARKTAAKKAPAKAAPAKAAPAKKAAAKDTSATKKAAGKKETKKSTSRSTTSKTASSKTAAKKAAASKATDDSTSS